MDNLFITNQSDYQISSIDIHTGESSIGVQVADFSLIEKGETHSFHMDEGKDCYFIVQIGGRAGDMNVIIAQEGFSKDFSYDENEQVHLFIRDGEDGLYISDAEL